MAVKKETETKSERNYWNEKVTIRLFKDSDRYKDDVTVGYNGKFYKIRRGVDVDVPRAVAEILRQSQEQDERTAEMIEKEQAAYDELETLSIL